MKYNNNNKRMGQKHFDIVKSSFNKDSNSDDIKNIAHQMVTVKEHNVVMK